MPEVTHVHVVETEEQGAQLVVDLIQEVVTANPSARLGTATGGTMEPLCRELGSRYAEGLLSLAEVETFQLDEYYPIDPWHPQSYRHFVRKHYVDTTDLPLTSAHVLNGATSDWQTTCERWEARLRERPIDLQLLGIGVKGHIAFVEAREEGGRALRESRTTLVDLDESTIRENKRFFPKGETQPTQALTVGIGTLLDVVEGRFVLAAFGRKKAAAIATALLGEVGDRCPASYIREARGQATAVLDAPAAGLLLERLTRAGEAPSHLHVRVH